MEEMLPLHKQGSHVKCEVRIMTSHVADLGDRTSGSIPERGVTEKYCSGWCQSTVIPGIYALEMSQKLTPVADGCTFWTSIQWKSEYLMDRWNRFSPCYWSRIWLAEEAQQTYGKEYQGSILLNLLPAFNTASKQIQARSKGWITAFLATEWTRSMIEFAVALSRWSDKSRLCNHSWPWDKAWSTETSSFFLAQTDPICLVPVRKAIEIKHTAGTWMVWTSTWYSIFVRGSIHCWSIEGFLDPRLTFMWIKIPRLRSIYLNPIFKVVFHRK